MAEIIDVGPSPPRKPMYLGDGVYASWDGFQVWLHVGAHYNPPCVALEPGVIANLNAYYAAARAG